DGRISGFELGESLGRAVQIESVTPARWARTLGDAARVSPLHTAVVRDALEKMLSSATRRKTASMVALFELTFELCTQTGCTISDPKAVSWLEGIAGSSKSAKLAKSMLAIRHNPNASVFREAAARALLGRIERAERWQRI